MRIRYLIFAIAMFVSSAFTLEHPLKMTFSLLKINKEGLAEIETRIFLDDLTAHIHQMYGPDQVDFSTLTGSGTQALQNYVDDSFYLKQDNKKIKLNINSVGMSKNQLALVINLNSTHVLDASKEITVVNTLLCDAFPLQMNNIKYLRRQYQLSMNKPEAILIPASTR
ncbi:MAG: DUF6702 family protein [Bacteroidota bacterium]